MQAFDTIKQQDQAYVMNTYARFDVAVKEGKGARCTDFDGKSYVDFTSGIGVNALGFCHSAWAEAVSEQAHTLCHISNLYYTEPCGQVAKQLCEASGMDKMFFANSGAEANEGAVKLARKYSLDKYGKGRHEIVTLVNSFHGRTITTLAATGQEVFHKNFDPFTQGFSHAPAGDLAALEAMVTDKTCAVIVELIQGEGGVLPLEPEYVQAVERLCREKDLLFIVDEVQTGIGRTGKLFCFEHYGIRPNVVTVAKGLGGGLPIGGVLADKTCAAVLGAGDHATTFGGNPIVCAGARCVLETVCAEGFLQTVEEKGAYIRKRLLAMPRVKEVRGKGLMIGADINGIAAKEVVAQAIREGLLLLTAKASVRLLPPLTITYEEIGEGLAILERVLAR